ncbi:MAG: hypothetical protein PVJ92_00865 [Candidatus Dependentiae bacterium]
MPYFFGDKKRTLSIDEAEQGDINPHWLDIRGPTGTPYSSTIKLSPERSVWGTILSMTQSLPVLHEGAWVRVTVPVCKVRHDLRMTETRKAGVTSAAGFASVADSMDSLNLRACRINKKPLTLWGVDDVLVHAGITMRTSDDGGNMQWYLEGVIPTGERPSGTYLFEPVQGSAGHAGFGIGVRSVMPLAQGENTTFSFCSHLHYRAMFSATQWRTPDFKGHPFSRYLVFMDSAQGGGTNFSSKAARGANFFTRQMHVSPGGQGQSMQGVLLSFGARRQHSLLLSYTYWWRMAEQLTFKRAADRTFATPKYAGTDATQQWVPSPLINEQYVTTDSSLTEDLAVVLDNEFNRESAAAPQTASHLLQLGYEATMPGERLQTNVQFSGQYELAENRAMVDAWAVCARINMQW